MAMLAEKKIKQKWSHDPRNKAWSTDTDRFGYQMLTKMGWSDGKGLGAKESGSTTHVKVSYKNDSLGVGAKVSHDDNWLAHQDDFNSLLSHLNDVNNDGSTKESDQAKNNDMETIARNSRKRVFYERFIKSKNTSSYSATDMACIMGKRTSKSAPDSPTEHSEDEDSDGSCASCPALSQPDHQGMTTVNSTQSVHEYFAMKMAELKQRREREQATDPIQENATATDGAIPSSERKEESSSEEKKKRKKDKKRKLEEPQEELVKKKRKKKSKKDPDNLDLEMSSNHEAEETLQENKSLKKKRTKKNREETIDYAETDQKTETSISESITVKRKGKKSKNNSLEDIDENGPEKTERKRKKKRKQEKEEVEPIQKTVDNNKKKSKKKKETEIKKYFIDTFITR